MKKVIFIRRIIYFLVITGMLIFIYNDVTENKFILIPFVICSASLLVKNILLLFDNNSVDIFNKIYIVGFLLFWFGFLFFYSYTCLISKEYLMLLFTVPFWIVGIYIIRKRLK